MATEADILAARRKRAGELGEKSVELFPARVPRPLASIADDYYGTTRAVDYLADLGWRSIGSGVVGLEPFLDDPDPFVRIAAAQAVWLTTNTVATWLITTVGWRGGFQAYAALTTSAAKGAVRDVEQLKRR